MADNHTKTIQVSSIEENKGRYKIKSTGGESFSFFDNWQGNTTPGMETFRKLNVVTGSVVDIVYTESASVNQSTGRPIVYKNIQRFLPSPGATPVGGVAKPPVDNGGRTIGNAVRTIQIDEERLESEIIGKTATQFLAAAIQSGNIDLMTARGQVDHAVMLAEALVNAAKGPHRQKLWKREGANIGGPPETEPGEIPFDPWEDQPHEPR